MFKIGDRIKVTDNFGNEEWFSVGEEGVIVYIGSVDALVQFQTVRAGGYQWYVPLNSMEKV